jgi:hypothetical protein
MELLWTDIRLLNLPPSLRRDLYFYAPLLWDLKFYGVDPVTYTRAGTTSAAYRGGSKTIAANVPPFEYSGELPLGLYLNTPATLAFNALNTLDDSDTLIWFEDGVAKSTPTNTNPFNAGGQWSGNVDIHVKHIIKAKRVLANSEIQQIQSVLTETVPVIPEPPEPPVNPIGSFVTETPAHVGGAVYELSQNPDLNSLLVAAHGGLFLKRVLAAPGNLEFVASGAGNKTLTLGLAPSPASNIVAQYVIA